MRAALGLIVVALLISAVDGSLLLRQDVSTATSAVVPLTLVSLPGINTSLGPDATSAIVNNVVLLVTSINTLQIAGNSSNSWSVRLHVAGATGMLAGESVTLGIFNGTSQTVLLTSASTFPQTSGYVTVPAGATANVTALSAPTFPALPGCGGVSPCTFQLQLRFTPSSTSGPTPEIVYSYTLNVL